VRTGIVQHDKDDGDTNGTIEVIATLSGHRDQRACIQAAAGAADEDLA
jgi:hypothetical protein